jgi:hypothetical protein
MAKARMVVLGLWLGLLGTAVVALDGPVALPQEVTAVVELEGGRVPGTRRIEVSIHVESLTPRETVRELASLVKVGGQGTLVAVMQKSVNGRIVFGAVEFPLNLIAVKATEGKTRYVIVTARPFGGTEASSGQALPDYPFGVMTFELDDRGMGQGTVFLAASIAVADDGSIVVESSSETPGRIVEARRK